MVAAWIAVLMLSSCAVDTTKSILQDSDGYLGREFVPSALPSSVRNIFLSSGKDMNFKKIFFKRKATVNELGTKMEWSSDVVYENAGSGLIRSKDILYINDIESREELGLSYRGVFILMSQIVRPNGKGAPFMSSTKSIEQIDLSFDKPIANEAFTWRSSAPRTNSIAMNMSCMFTSAYPAATVVPGARGMGRQYSCHLINSNGVATAEQDFLYLVDYGVAIMKSGKNNYGYIHWTYTDFKLE